MIKEFVSGLGIVTAAFIVAVGLSACSSDDATADNSSAVTKKGVGDAVNFTVVTAGGSTTRAFSTLDNYWTMNDLMAVREGSTVYQYKAASSSTSSGSRVSIVPNTDDAYAWSPEVTQRTFSAWYPYSSTPPSSVAGVTDQRSDNLGRPENRGTMTNTQYNNLDLLYAPDVAVSYKQPVDLVFYHQMCRIVVTVNSTGTKGSKPVTSVTFGKNNIAAGGTLTPGYTGAEGSTASWSITKNTSVQMRLVNAIAVDEPTTIRQYTYECIVPPQSLAASEVLFQITTTATTASDNTTTTTEYKPGDVYQDAPDFRAGYQYNFMLTLSRAGLISISTVSVNDWATENVNGLTATVPDAGY